MFDVSTLVSFVAVVLGLFLIPGPAVLLLLSRTAQGGRSVGMTTALGIAVGDFLHTLFAAIGLSALLMTSALAFTLVKMVGAGYLLYLGIKAFKEKKSGAKTQVASEVAITPMRAFWQAIPAELFNPKTALFFLAFLPQFVHADHGNAFTQFAVLGLIFVVMGIVYASILVCLTQPIGLLVKRLKWVQRFQGKIIGTIFISLSLKVALQQQ